VKDRDFHRAAEGLEQHREVGDLAGEDPESVQRRGEGDSVPCEGLKPTTPQNAAGRMIDPAVCVPSAAGAMKSATAAAEPLEEPPGVRSSPFGLRVGPGEKKASSVVTVFPRITAPAARRAATQAASRPGRRPRRSAVPHSVGASAVSMMSLIPTGSP